MIPVTDLGIWGTGVSEKKKRFTFLPDQRKNQSSKKVKERKELIEGLKTGITIWGLLSVVSISFWGTLIYWLFF
jgi:nitrate reductase NapE component